MYSLATTLLTQVTVIFLPFNGIIPIANLDCQTSWYSGMYEKTSQTIYVCEWEFIGKRSYISQFTLYHELWHHYWWQITQAQRDKYTQAYNRAKVFYRDYGKESVQEDFADNFSLLSRGEYTTPSVQRRINMIRSFNKTPRK